MLSRIVYLFVALFLAHAVQSQQQYNAYSLNELYNFDISTVYDIKQDKHGDFWLGTDQGMVHFNGYEFQLHYSAKYGRESTNIKLDREGRSWYSNFGGQLFYLEKDSVHVAIDQSAGLGFIMDYFPYSDSLVYYFLQNTSKIIQYDIKNNVSQVLWEPLNKDAFIMSMKQRGNQIDVVVNEQVGKARNEIVRYTFDLHTRTSKRIKTTIEAPVSLGIIKYVEDSCYYIYFKPEEFGVLNLDRKNPELFKKQNVFSLNSVYVDDQKIFLLKKNGVQEISLVPPYQSATVIQGLNASTYLKDKEGNVWIGSLSEGIQIIPNAAFRHRKLTHHKIHQSVVSPDGTIYFLDSEDKLLMSPYPYSTQVKLADNISSQGYMTYDSVNNTLFLSHHNQAFSVDKKRFIPSELRYFKRLHFLDKKTVVVTRGDGAIITTIDKSPVVWDRVNYNFGEVINQQKDHQFTTIRNVRSQLIAEAKNRKHLYIGYIDGVYHYSHSKKPAQLQFKGQKIHATTLVADTKNGVWVTTTNQELIRYEGDRPTFSFKLPETVNALVQNNDLLYLSCNNGIYRIHVPQREMTLINKADGLLKGKVTSLFYYNDSLYIVSGDKIQSIPCSYNYTNTTPPEIFIDAVLLFDEILPLQTHYSLSNDENNLTFSFRTNAIRGQDLIRYQYRLSNGDWITTPAHTHQSIFSNLAPGTYTFEVRVVNEDGIVSPSKKINFTIDKHFTRTWWFLLLVFISVTVIILLIVQYRYKVLQQRNRLYAQKQELRKEVYKSKIAAIRSQMNPHFIFNALNTIQEFIITNQKDIASEYLADFADLIRKYLEQSRKEEIFLDEEIETLEIYLSLENLRSNGQLDYSIYCDPLVNQFETLIPVMLLQPFIENAIKHGLLHKVGTKSLQISFHKKGEHRLRCCIEDNGIGREAAAKFSNEKHNSFATEAIDEKMELLNKNTSRNISIEIVDLKEGDATNATIATGTKVIIEFDL